MKKETLTTLVAMLALVAGMTLGHSAVSQASCCPDGECCYPKSDCCD